MVRNNSIDIAKSIGIFLVIWAHTICPIKSIIDVFSMSSFFMLSGYVFNTRDGFVITLGKKLKTLLIPFFIFYVFQRIAFIIISMIGDTYKTQYLLPWYPIPPWRTMGVLWFLTAMFIVTMTYSLIGYLRSDIKKFFACLLLSYIGYLFSSHNIHVPMHLGSSLSMMVFFCIGNLLAKIEFGKTWLVWNWMITGFGCLILYFISIKFYLPIIVVANNVLEGDFSLNLLLMTIGCMMIFLNSKVIDFIPYVNTILAYIGKNSLTIYAIQAVILETIYLVFPKNIVSITGGIMISLFILATGLLVNLGLQKYFPFALGKQDLIPGRLFLSGLVPQKKENF